MRFSAAIFYFAYLAMLAVSESFGFVVNSSSSFKLGMSSGRLLKSIHGMISSGFSFEDSEQILVSVQKPLGIVLEQESGPIVVKEVESTSAAGRAGVKVGDVLVAVQNASVESVDLESVLEFIRQGPRVINLRLMRGQDK